MPDWTNEGGPGAGHDPRGGRKILLCLAIALVIGIALIKLGVIR